MVAFTAIQPVLNIDNLSNRPVLNPFFSYNFPRETLFKYDFLGADLYHSPTERTLYLCLKDTFSTLITYTYPMPIADSSGHILIIQNNLYLFAEGRLGCENSILFLYEISIIHKTTRKLFHFDHYFRFYLFKSTLFFTAEEFWNLNLNQDFDGFGFQENFVTDSLKISEFLFRDFSPLRAMNQIL